MQLSIQSLILQMGTDDHHMRTRTALEELAVVRPESSLLVKVHTVDVRSQAGSMIELNLSQNEGIRSGTRRQTGLLWLRLLGT